MKKELDSPVVASVREARRRVAAEYGYDLGKLCQALRQMERASGRKTGTPKHRKARPQAK
ncbi:MAG: hypothetical protein NT031_14480 [Planctomycetota bacterium]|nr:hypothetical protein [Planctomycetota bacterium]